MHMFDEIRFPEDISYGAIGGPEFFTEISTSINGIEHRNINWNKARAKYNISYGIKSEDQLKKIIAFFYARRGRAIGFRFKDWTDYTAKNEIIYNSSQLIKTYKSGNNTYIRKITKPIPETVILYINSEKYEEKFNVDYTTGKILFETTPNGIISADFEFDIPVRFDNDYLSASIDDYNTYSWKDINLIEIKT